ncbi:MAG TPA: methyltransferase domain-containing protein [Patescibacteria group bacterium]|nr:methyltransferase domain-containing protein [Patescibacteria group bacterium]
MLSRQTDQITKFGGYHSLDLTNKIYQVKALRLISTLNLHPSSSILELGSADDSFLQLVCRQTNGRGRGLDITQGDDLEKPFKIKSAAVDLVLALEIIEHLFDTDQFLSEIYRVLKPGGYLILSTPNLASLTNRLKLLVGGYPHYLEYSRAGAGHIHLYTPAILTSQLQTAGFKTIRLTSPNFLCPFITKPWFPQLFRDFCIYLGDLLPTLGSHLIVVASKQSVNPACSRGKKK